MFYFRLFHLVITIGFQFLVMRDIEKLTGCIRLAIIYLGSGVAGNLASSIFLPYHVEVIFFKFKIAYCFHFNKSYWCKVDSDITCKNTLFAVKLVHC